MLLNTMSPWFCAWDRYLTLPFHRSGDAAARGVVIHRRDTGRAPLNVTRAVAGTATVARYLDHKRALLACKPHRRRASLSRDIRCLLNAPTSSIPTIRCSRTIPTTPVGSRSRFPLNLYPTHFRLYPAFKRCAQRRVLGFPPAGHSGYRVSLLAINRVAN